MRLLTSLIFFIATGVPAIAEPITLSASSFPAGSYIFDFQFINGDQVVGNNTANISGFIASGVSLTSLQTFGSVTGTDLASGLTLVDGPITEVQEAFTSSGTPWNISFDVSYTGNYSAPGPGDAFTFTITDTSLNPINSSGDGSLLEAAISGPNSPLSTSRRTRRSNPFSRSSVRLQYRNLRPSLCLDWPLWLWLEPDSGVAGEKCSADHTTH